jgi:tRNA nucleotidyltransferase (CCA-adding enzyme)
MVRPRPARAGRRGARRAMMNAVILRSGQQLLADLAALPAASRLVGAPIADGGLYLVGGAVRDLLLNRPPVDLDLVCEGDVGAAARQLGSPVRLHDRFGTSTLQSGGLRWDLAMARRELYERPGALPRVEPATIDDDLTRRDFTVNAIALGIAGPRAGELIAVPGALDDLDRGRLRILHDASFVDDPTRLLRLARYSARLGFAADGRTRALAGAAVASGALDTVSGPRIGAELRLLAAEQEPAAAFAALADLGVASAIAPGLGQEAPAVLRRALSIAPAGADRGALVLAWAWMSVAAEVPASLLHELAFTAGSRDIALAARDRARALAGELAAAVAPSEILSAAGGVADELVALAGAAGPPAAFASARRWLAELRTQRPAIDGRDLIAAGIAPGPAVGAGLRAALVARLDGRATGREEELAEAIRVAGAGGSGTVRGAGPG